MNQTEREYRDALDNLRFTDETKERMMKNLMEQGEQKPPKRRGVRPLRVVLIAAALCLALVGATGAAHFLGVRIWGGGSGNIRLSGGVTYQPYDSLSDEIKALGDMAQTKTFSSWQEAEDFIGIDLMNNPVLDASPATDYSIEYCGERGRFFVSTGYRLTEVSTLSCFQIGDVKINMESYLYTDRMAELQGEWEDPYAGISFAEGTKLSRETYTAPSGLEALVLKADREDYHSYLALFSLNGVPFVVQTHSYSGAEDARAVLLQILDGFAV